MKKIITKQEYLVAQGLYHLAQEHYQKYEEFLKGLSDVFEIPRDDWCGIIGDKLLNGECLQDGMDILEIKVKR